MFDPIDCDDGDPCTINDRCDPALGCVSELKCPTDELICNGKEECCSLAACSPSVGFGQCLQTPPSCDDLDPCTCDSCSEDAGGCVNVKRECDDGDPCTVDSCDPSSTNDCTPGQGCLHEPIPDCCRKDDDCRDACTTGRRCVDKVCTAGAAVSCDDADLLTVDACDPAVGCTHTTTPAVTICHVDADCPPEPDPCKVAVCAAGAGCTSRPASGLDSLACICRRADPSSCEGAKLPRSVTAKRTQACGLIAKATSKPARERKLVRRAGKLLARAGRRVAKARSVDPACRQDTRNLLADGVARAGALEH